MQFFSGLVSLFVGTWVPMQFNLIQHNHDIVLSNLQFITGKILKSILPAALVPEMGTDVGSKSAAVKWVTPCSRQNDVFDFPGGYHFIMRFYVWGSFFCGNSICCATNSLFHRLVFEFVGCSAADLLFFSFFKKGSG